jgi:hypothetical protein
MNGRTVMKVAAAIYFAEAFLFILTVAVWPFVEKPPFVIHKAVFAGIVALACALLGVWSLKIGRGDKMPSNTYLACSAMMVIGFGPLSGYALIGALLVPLVVASFGVHRLRSVGHDS